MKQVLTFKWFMTTGVLAATLLTSLGANALSDPCSLIKTATPVGLGMSRDEIRAYESKLSRECQITTQFRNIKLKLQADFQMGIESITEYQAIRYLRRSDFEAAKAAQIPVQKKYQIVDPKDKGKVVAVEEMKTTVWDNWIIGISQLGEASNKLLRGQHFNVSDLKDVHVGFYRLANEDEDAGSKSDKANAPNVGLFKPAHEADVYWWEFRNREEATAAENILTQVNSQFRKMDFLEIVQGDYSDILRVKYNVLKRGEAAGGKVVDVIYGGDSRVNEAHIYRIVSFLNAMIDQALTGQHMVWKGKMMTPTELAYFVQKYYVAVHPFADGNGRTSRFLQDLVLYTFDMPHGASGDLMENDILITFPDYYERAIATKAQMLSKVESCMQSYKKSNLRNYKKIKLSPSVLDYSCRYLD